ncbi:hypothetical protein V8F06_007780 [Rhypophila decipiens]
MSEPVPETTVNAPDGDVIFVVGAAPKARLRVYSRILSAGSSVFSAMFNGNWAEGKDLSSACPKEIELPEDNPTAILIICRILHHQNNQVPESLGADMILKVVVHAEKYDLITAVRFVTSYWLDTSSVEIGVTSNVLEDGNLLAAAFILGDLPNFKRISLNLILRHVEPYSSLYQQDQLRDILPSITFCLLEERRDAMRHEIQEIWSRGITDACAEQCDDENLACGWGRYRMERYQALQNQYITRTLGNIKSPIWTLINASRDDYEFDMQGGSHCGGNTCDCHIRDSSHGDDCDNPIVHHAGLRPYDRFEAIVEVLKRRFALCFDCLDYLEGKKDKCANQLGFINLGPKQG